MLPLIFLIFTVFISTSTTSDLPITICGFPENSYRCDLDDLTCVDALEKSARVFSYTEEAQNYNVYNLDPLYVPSITLDLFQYKLTFNNVVIRGVSQSYGNHEVSNVTGAFIEGYYWHTGNLTADSVVYVAPSSQNTFTENVTINFTECGSRTVIAVTPMQRCDEKVYFNVTLLHREGLSKDETGIDITSDFAVSLINQGAYTANFFEEMTSLISVTIIDHLMTNLLYLHIAEPAESLWVLTDDLVMGVPLGAS